MANEVVKGAPKSGVVARSAQPTIASLLNDPGSKWGVALAKVLPKPGEVARFMMCALGQLSDPKVGAKLAACTQASFYNAIQKSARCGIVPDGVNAYLIPYGRECTLQFSYRGLCDMAIREGIATKFASDVVRRNDVFKWSNGELVEHTVVEWDEDARGEIVGVWVRAFLPGGEHQDMRMSVSDIEKVRAKSQNPNGVWKEWYEEMAKKSCLKRLFKTMRNTPAMSEAIASDNEEYHMDETAAKPNGVNAVRNVIDFGDASGETVEAEVESGADEPPEA